MGNTAKKLEVPKRNFLSRTIGYRNHLKGGYYIFNAYLSVLALTSGYFLFQSLMQGNFDQALQDGAWFGLFLFVPILFSVFVFRRMIKTQVQVESTYLVIQKPQKVLKVPYNKIQSIRFATLPAIGGWFKLQMKSGKSHRFSVLLERSDYILESIAAFDGQLISDENYTKYHSHLITSDHSWARVYNMSLKKVVLGLFVFPLLSVLFFLVPKVIMGFEMDFSKVLFYLPEIYLILFIMNALVWTVRFFAKEAFLTIWDYNYFRNHPTEVKRNLKRDRKVERGFSAIHFIAFNVFVLLQYWPS